jgi:tousled-like kinase
MRIETEHSFDGAFSYNCKHQGSGNEAAKILDGMDPRPSLDNTNRKKQARGRGRAGTGRGRGSKTVDQIRSTSASSVVTTNGQLDKLTNKVCQLFVIMVSI